MEQGEDVAFRWESGTRIVSALNADGSFESRVIFIETVSSTSLVALTVRANEEQSIVPKRPDPNPSDSGNRADWQISRLQIIQRLVWVPADKLAVRVGAHCTNGLECNTEEIMGGFYSTAVL